MYEIMTPGPTQVPEETLKARAQWAPNPDLDDAFVEFYHKTAARITGLVGGTENHETFLLSGEGMLALEACVATLTEPGDRVLILDNGVFGAGFADLVSRYGGIPVVYNTDYRRPLNPIALGYYLESNHKFKYATLVHCDTPSGILNPIAEICQKLKSFGILTVVDAVASMFGEPVNVRFGVDFLCGASQKALSAPAGLCFVTLSQEAKEAVLSRKSPVPGFYANLQNYIDYYEKRYFPYTMPAHDIQGLAAALDLVEADQERYRRHDLIAKACRAAIEKGGLALYPESGFSNTVTVVCIPEGMTDKQILAKMREEHGILLADSFDVLAGKVIRIGHMGHNCQGQKVSKTLAALDTVLTDLGFPIRDHLEETFARRFRD